MVGPCAAGKSTLVAALKTAGFDALQVAQEHSFVPDMWSQIARPNTLIYLDASYEACSERKKLDWAYEDYAEQLRRLEHAREHCDIYLHTDGLSPEEVVGKALAWLDDRQASGPEV